MRINQVEKLKQVNYYFLDSNKEAFADGTLFNYRDLLSLENLELVKASNNKFKDVDVKALFEDGATLIVKGDRMLIIKMK